MDYPHRPRVEATVNKIQYEVGTNVVILSSPPSPVPRSPLIRARLLPHVCYPPPLTLPQLIKDLTQSKSKISFLPSTKDDPSKRKPDISLAKEKLGWEPVVAVHEVGSWRGRGGGVLIR